MKTLMYWLLILVCIIVLPISVSATALVESTQIILPTGDTAVFTLDITESGVLVITQEAVTQDSSKYFKLETIVSPDQDNDGKVELAMTYTSPSPPDPYDVNLDGVVNGYDFLTLFQFIFMRIR